jgi:hypothetical protein
MCRAPGPTRPLGRSSCHRSADRRRIKNLSSTGTKGRSFRGATHIRQCRSLADGPGSRGGWRAVVPLVPPATPADRCCPVSLALCAGAYWRALEARGLVRRLTGPFALVAAPACTNRWFSTPAPGGTRPDHSPYWECGGSLRAGPAACQTMARGCGAEARRPAPRLELRRHSSATEAAVPHYAAARRHRGATETRPLLRIWPNANPGSTSPGWQLGEASNLRQGAPSTGQPRS